MRAILVRDLMVPTFEKLLIDVTRNTRKSGMDECQRQRAIIQAEKLLEHAKHLENSSKTGENY